MISSKMFYAIAAMAQVSEKSTSPITLSEISRKLDISTSYVEQLFTDLRSHGLVEGVRGPGGGYRLSKPAISISIADIISAYQTHHITPKRSKRPSSGSKHAVLSSALWDELSAQLYHFLSTITLATYTKNMNRASLIPDSCTSYKIATMFPSRQNTQPEHARAG